MTIVADVASDNPSSNYLMHAACSAGLHLLFLFGVSFFLYPICIGAVSLERVTSCSTGSRIPALLHDVF